MVAGQSLLLVSPQVPLGQQEPGEHRAPLCAEWQGCDAGMQSHEVRREEKSGEVSGIPCFRSRGEEQGTQL